MPNIYLKVYVQNLLNNSLFVNISIYIIISTSNFKLRAKDESAKARREDKERQDKLEERLDRAETRTVPASAQEDGDRYGGGRIEDRTGDRSGGGKIEDNRRQCREQLFGRCKEKQCPHYHRAPCQAYRENGVKDSPNFIVKI